MDDMEVTIRPKSLGNRETESLRLHPTPLSFLVAEEKTVAGSDDRTRKIVALSDQLINNPTVTVAEGRAPDANAMMRTRVS
jgi:hypothetical protein